MKAIDPRIRRAEADGRIAEDFAASGTWVSVGPLRAEVLQAMRCCYRTSCSWVSIVITGRDPASRSRRSR